MPAGAVELALRTGAALVPAFGLRLSGRRYRISIEPPLDLDGQTVPAAAQALIAIMERYIKEHPEQWVVFEPRWGKAAGREEPWQDSGERTSTLTPA